MEHPLTPSVVVIVTLAFLSLPTLVVLALRMDVANASYFFLFCLNSIHCALSITERWQPITFAGVTLVSASLNLCIFVLGPFPTDAVRLVSPRSRTLCH